MLDLTFGEQVKIILKRKGMTIKELAKLIEEQTGKKMSRQNMTQRLNRDNFQEQDMRAIASILGCRRDSRRSLRRAGRGSLRRTNERSLRRAGRGSLRRTNGREIL